MIRKTLITSTLLASAMLLSPVIAHADTQTPEAPSQSTTDKSIVTTTDNDQYKQLLATVANLKQKISDLNGDLSLGGKTRSEQVKSLKVQESNIKSQIQVVVTKQDKDKQAADELAKAEQEKAAQAAQEKAAQEQADKDQAAKDQAAKEQAAQEQANASQDDTQAQSNSQPQAPQTPATSDTRSALVAYGKTLLGIPYVWGGTSVTSGLDCSGFTSQVYAHVTGQDIGRTTWNQDGTGQHISLSELKPGDLILEYGKGHVAMYIGNGQQIDAPKPGDVVSVRAVPYDYGALYGLRYIN